MYSKLFPGPTCSKCIIFYFICLIGLDIYLLLIKSCNDKTETYSVFVLLSMESSSFKWFTRRVSVQFLSLIHLICLTILLYSLAIHAHNISFNIKLLYMQTYNLCIIPYWNYLFFQQKVNGRHLCFAYNSTHSLNLFFLVFREIYTASKSVSNRSCKL